MRMISLYLEQTEIPQAIIYMPIVEIIRFPEKTVKEISGLQQGLWLLEE